MQYVRSRGFVMLYVRVRVGDCILGLIGKILPSFMIVVVRLLMRRFRGIVLICWWPLGIIICCFLRKLTLRLLHHGNYFFSMRHHVR
jgi:hypothetical protein